MGGDRRRRLVAAMKDLATLPDYVDCAERGLDGGAFRVPFQGRTLLVVASFGMGWDHLSVSLIRGNRTPNWAEMEYVKRLFFKDGETAMQLHVPVADHLSIHPHVLHLWRPQNVKIPMPPRLMV
jgi:hypothetical protein